MDLAAGGQDEAGDGAHRRRSGCASAGSGTAEREGVDELQAAALAGFLEEDVLAGAGPLAVAGEIGHGRDHLLRGGLRVERQDQLAGGPVAGDGIQRIEIEGGVPRAVVGRGIALERRRVDDDEGGVGVGGVLHVEHGGERLVARLVHRVPEGESVDHALPDAGAAIVVARSDAAREPDGAQDVPDGRVGRFYDVVCAYEQMRVTAVRGAQVGGGRILDGESGRRPRLPCVQVADVHRHRIERRGGAREIVGGGSAAGGEKRRGDGQDGAQGTQFHIQLPLFS